MARASHKIDLLEDSNKGYQELMNLIDSLSKEEQEGTFPFEDRDRNVRDVLIHLHEWHNMMKKWYQVGCIEGGTPVIPREGYTFRTLPEMNKLIWEEYQDTTLEESKKMFEQSHTEIIKLIESHTNEQLFLRNQYKWTGETVLGSYFVSSTASHYEWAMTKIKKYKKALKKK